MLGRRNGGNDGTCGTCGTFHSFLTFLRQLAGMPDYERHLQHLRQCHPEQQIPTERKYFEEYLRSRYRPGPTRCC